MDQLRDAIVRTMQANGSHIELRNLEHDFGVNTETLGFLGKDRQWILDRDVEVVAHDFLPSWSSAN